MKRNIIFTQILNEITFKHIYKNFTKETNSLKKHIFEFLINYKNKLLIKHLCSNFKYIKNKLLTFDKIIFKKKIFKIMKEFTPKYYVITINKNILYTNIQKNYKNHITLNKIAIKNNLKTVFYNNDDNFFNYLSKNIISYNYLICNHSNITENLLFLEIITKKKLHTIFNTKIILKCFKTKKINIIHIFTDVNNLNYLKFNQINFYLNNNSKCTYEYINNSTNVSSILNTNISIIQKEKSFFNATIINKNNTFIRNFYNLIHFDSNTTNEINLLNYQEKKSINEFFFYAKFTKTNIQLFCNTYSIIKGNAKFLFDGLINIEKKSKNITAILFCKGFTNSKKSNINFIPKFNIKTNDTTAKHGVNICQTVNKNELQYLKSRGLSHKLSKKIFFDSLILLTIKKNINTKYFKKYIKNIFHTTI